MTGRYRIGFDIGGTFTDFILFDAERGAVTLHKTLTTPQDPSIAAMQGLAEIVAMARITLAEVADIVHGTTLVANAVIEGKGARLGLITTEGFRDILEQGAEQRYDIYDLFLGFPAPLVPRDLRLGVPERIDRDGQVVTPLDEAAVRAALRTCLDAGVEAVAVCFLHAYRNAAHERRVGAIARAEFPELTLSLSSEVVPEISEYTRCATTCANAYVQPLMDRYLKRLERELAARGFRGALRLMHSAGGLIAPETARAFPIRLLESGPAGGGLATALFGRLAGRKDVISFDMGGTTAKACMVEDGRVEVAPMLEAARVHRFTRGSGLPIKAPVIDMIEIGAGGGSIAAIDAVGLLKVGPHSAASDPGPACYGLGGTQPTVTDANLVLGYYDPGFFLGGRMRLDLAAARAAIGTVAQPLGLSIEAAAAGIHTVVVESMAAAARVHLVEKGKDPRRYAMVGFGGAGPAHAADVARALGVTEVIIPPASGAASALGFLAAPLSFESVRSFPVSFAGGFDAAALNALLAEIEAEARSQLLAAGVPAEAVTVERLADMRLERQMHDVAVPLPPGALDAASLPAIREAFDAVYTARFTAPFPDAQIEAINFRVRCSGPVPQLSIRGAVAADAAETRLKGTRQAWFDGAWHATPVYSRYALQPGERIAGPAIVEERESTTVVAPGDALTVDAGFNLCIAVQATRAAAERITAETPVAEAAALIEADPIALEIMWARLVTVVEEMWLTVCRTAFSLIISEAQDFACDLLDAQGETLAHSPRAMPVFNLTMPRAVKALLEAFPPETLAPGDVLITNDPWLCAGHLPDLCIVTPIFLDGTLVGLTATVGNVSDIGGTKDSHGAREVYDEGFQIPPMKLQEAGRPNATLLALLGKNVRNAYEVLGDVHSMMAANAVGGERLLAFMRDYGLRDLRALAKVVQDRSEKAMRDAIRALPDGVYEAESWNNPQGTQLRYPVRITVAGDAMTIDFAGAPAQLPLGGYNCTMNYTAAHATYPMKCILTPGVRGNAGCYRPFTVLAPEGSILNATYPAACNMRARTGWYIAPAVFNALAEAAPRGVQATTGLPYISGIYARDTDGTLRTDSLFMGGGQGASAHGDGKSALLWPTSASNTALEMFESRVPVLIMEKELLPDSGGPGRHRGGLGQRVRYRKLHDDGRLSLVSAYPEGVDDKPPGLFGGQPGARARIRLTRRDGTLIRDLGRGERVQLTDADVVIDVLVAGGAGYGPPEERPRAALEQDLRLGLVSPEAARRDYGMQSAPARAALGVVGSD
jgi:5-oxoprolinase (ATP-hydrolysing)/N-methylhydantoinase A